MSRYDVHCCAPIRVVRDMVRSAIAAAEGKS
jgi:hypothetical protein